MSSASPLSSSLGAAGPPSSNPILTAYESFIRDTPWITRSTLLTLLGTWILSSFVFFNLAFALGTIPFHVLYRFEVYRLVLSPFICTHFLSLILAYFSFLESGKRLEYSLGSTAFGLYVLSVGLCTNLVFIAIMLIIYFVTGESTYLWKQSIGIWTVLFALISAECTKAPRDSKRQLFFLTVPSLYYPIALWALFLFMGGANVAEFVSILVGYAYGHGYLDRFKPGVSRCNQLEETILSRCTRWDGWVNGHAALGSGAWSSENSSEAFSLFGSLGNRQMSTDASNGGDSLPTWGFSAPGQTSAPRDPAASTESSSFPQTGGRALGSGPAPTASSRPSSEAREAMLAAAERRVQSDKKNQQV